MANTSVKKEINNERELINQSVDFLNQYNRNVISTNNSNNPTLVIGLGEKTRDAIIEVRKALECNWSNAMHLEFLQLNGSDGETGSIRRFRSLEEHEQLVDSGIADSDRYEWIEAPGDFVTEAEKAQIRMLEKKNSFAETNAIKIDFILNATEKDAESYYELFKQYRIESNHKMFKTLFLLLSQKNLDHALEHSEKMLQKVQRDTDLNNCCVYVLSDELSDGSMLPESELVTNYRLIADLIFLGSDRENLSSGKIVLESGVKLASYTIFSKPIDQIGEVTIGHCVNLIYEEEEKRFSQTNLEIDDIKRRLGINKSTIEIVEIEWKKFCKKLPSAGENPIDCFPYQEKGSLNAVRKECKRDMRAGIRLLNQATMGVSDAYLEMTYRNSIGNYFIENNIRKRVFEYIKTRFNYFELLRIGKHLNHLKEFLMIESKPSYAGNNLEEGYIRLGMDIAKAEFSREMRHFFCEAIEKLVALAEAFQRNYTELCEQIKVVRSSNGEEDASIEKCYRQVVIDYINKQRGNSAEIAFSELFDVEHDRKDIIRSLYNLYVELVKSVEIYSFDFEKELQFRMDNLATNALAEMIRDYFADNMDKNLRLHAVTQLRPQLLPKGSFYMLNTEAVYYSYLEKSEEFEHNKYSLIKLRRKDGIEQVGIYDIKPGHVISISSKGTSGFDSSTCMKSEAESLQDAYDAL